MDIMGNRRGKRFGLRNKRLGAFHDMKRATHLPFKTKLNAILAACLTLTPDEWVLRITKMVGRLQ